MRTAVWALLALVALPAAASKETLARAQFPSLRKTARFVTLQRWDGRVDEMLATYGQVHAAPPAWKPGDLHWEEAKAKMLARFSARIDQLLPDPETEALMMKGFATMSDADADGVAVKVNPDIIDYSDVVIISVETMVDKNLSSSIDPAVLAVQRKWGAKPVAPNSPVAAAANDPGVRRLMDARSSAVRFLSTGLDGQLQLLLFDRQVAFQKDIDTALAACAKARHK
jgi:hypothetical protein